MQLVDGILVSFLYVEQQGINTVLFNRVSDCKGDPGNSMLWSGPVLKGRPF